MAFNQRKKGIQAFVIHAAGSLNWLSLTNNCCQDNNCLIPHIQSSLSSCVDAVRISIRQQQSASTLDYTLMYMTK